MNLLLTLLLLAPLLLPPVFSMTPYDKFKLQHIVNLAVDCSVFLNHVLLSLNKQCKLCNSIILTGGGATLNSVKEVCTKSGGNFLRGNLYESKEHFPVVECILSSGYQPPKCSYWQIPFKYKKIILACDQSGFPVHFQETC